MAGLVGLSIAVASPKVDAQQEPNQSRLPEETSSSASSSQEVSDEKTPTSTAPTNPTGSESGGDEPEDEQEESSSPPESTTKKDPVTYCNDFMTAYIESASRKLYRAVAGQELTLEKLKLQDWIEVKAPSGDGDRKKVEFRVYRQKGGLVAGLVDTERSYRRTLIVAMTDKGPIVASHQWPSSEQIASGTKCRPTSSRLDYPLVTLSKLDVEPFKFWGLRVLWRLPPSFNKGRQNRDSVYKTIVEVMKDAEEKD